MIIIFKIKCLKTERQKSAKVDPGLLLNLTKNPLKLKKNVCRGLPINPPNAQDRLTDGQIQKLTHRQEDK